MSRPGEDPEARFRRLFNDTRHDLLAYAVRRTNRPEDAADVVAETYLIAWRKLNSLPTGGEARLWLFGVARNVVLRGASREHALQTLVDRLALGLHDMRSTTELADGQLPPRLRAALEGLPVQQREVLLLTAWEGLTPREVAAVTGAPVNLVRVRLHRARSRLRRELAEAKPTSSSRASRQLAIRPSPHTRLPRPQSYGPPEANAPQNSAPILAPRSPAGSGVIRERWRSRGTLAPSRAPLAARVQRRFSSQRAISMPLGRGDRRCCCSLQWLA